MPRPLLPGPPASRPGHSLSLSRLLPVGSGWEAVGVNLAASPLGVAPESFPGKVGYLCSTRKGPSYWKETERRVESAYQAQNQTQLGNPWIQALLGFLRAIFHSGQLRDLSKIWKGGTRVLQKGHVMRQEQSHGQIQGLLQRILNRKWKHLTKGGFAIWPNAWRLNEL